MKNWKAKIKYYLNRNPFGFFLVLLHWGIAYKLVTYMSFGTVNEAMRGAEIGLVGLLFLFILDLPAIIFSAVLLFPMFILGGTETYFILVFFIAVFTITFQWLVVGKKVTGFFWKSEAEKKELSIFNVI